MKIVWCIARREWRSFFGTPTGYIVLAAFLLITGWFFANPLFIKGQANLQDLFNVIPIIFIVFIPAISMNLLARERQTSTFELIATLPVSEWQIIGGKFLACLGIIAIALAFTLVHYLTLLALTPGVDYGPVAGGYLGLLFLGAFYGAVCLLVGAMSKNQVIAFLLGFFVCMAFYLVDKILFFLPWWASGFFQYLSSDYHYSSMGRGVLDTRDIIYFVSFSFFFLLLARNAIRVR